MTYHWRCQPTSEPDEDDMDAWNPEGLITTWVVYVDEIDGVAPDTPAPPAMVGLQHIDLEAIGRVGRELGDVLDEIGDPLLDCFDPVSKFLDDQGNIQNLFVVTSAWVLTNGGYPLGEVEAGAEAAAAVVEVLKLQHEQSAVAYPLGTIAVEALSRLDPPPPTDSVWFVRLGTSAP